MKGAKVRRAVRKMWANEALNSPHVPMHMSDSKKEAMDKRCVIAGQTGQSFPVAVVDLRPAAMEAHVEAMAEAFQSYFCPEGADPEEQQQVRAAARAALAALMKGRTGAPRR